MGTVGRRGDAAHDRLMRHLTGSSAPWVSTASLLIANLAHRFVEGTDWEYSEFSLYDLGQAVAHMTLQAESFGLSARQFRAFNRDGLRGEFAVPEHWEVTIMVAIGRAAVADAPSSVPATSSSPARQRRAVNDILWPVS